MLTSVGLSFVLQPSTDLHLSRVPARLSSVRGETPRSPYVQPSPGGGLAGGGRGVAPRGRFAPCLGLLVAPPGGGRGVPPGGDGRREAGGELERTRRGAELCRRLKAQQTTRRGPAAVSPTKPGPL